MIYAKSHSQSAHSYLLRKKHSQTSNYLDQKEDQKLLNLQTRVLLLCLIYITLLVLLVVLVFLVHVLFKFEADTYAKQDKLNIKKNQTHSSFYFTSIENISSTLKHEISLSTKNSASTSTIQTTHTMLTMSTIQTTSTMPTTSSMPTTSKIFTTSTIENINSDIFANNYIGTSDVKIFALALAPNGYLISGANELLIKVWNPVNGRLIFNKVTTALVRKIVILDDTLIGVLVHSEIEIWNLTRTEFEKVKVINCEFTSNDFISLNRDNLIAVGLENGEISIINYSSGEINHKISIHEYSLSALVLLPTGYLASIAEGDFKISVTNLENSVQVGDFDFLSELNEYLSFYTKLAISKENHLISGHDEFILVWNVYTYEKIKKLEVTRGVYSLAVLDNGLLVSGLENSLSIWNLASNSAEPIQVLESANDADGVWSLAVLNENCLASGSRHIYIWNLTSLTRVYNLTRHQEDAEKIRNLVKRLDVSTRKNFKLFI